MTGASRRFGRELTSAVLANGDRIVAAARNPQAVLDEHPDSEKLLAVPSDVTNEHEAHAAVAAAVERFGRIDVLVNNAGYGLFGAVEEFSDDEVRDVFDTNVFGLLNVTRAVLPTMRAQGFGHVINMGSSAGIAAGAGRGLYGASKFAVEAITEALHAELRPHGIHAKVIEPGSFRTDFLTGDSRRTPASTIDAYAETSGALLTAIDTSNGRQPGDPGRAAEAILHLAATDDPPLRLPLGSDCVALIETKLQAMSAELDQWRDLALSTDFRVG